MSCVAAGANPECGLLNHYSHLCCDTLNTCELKTNRQINCQNKLKRDRKVQFELHKKCQEGLVQFRSHQTGSRPKSVVPHIPLTWRRDSGLQMHDIVTIAGGGPNQLHESSVRARGAAWVLELLAPVKTVDGARSNH